MHCSCRFHLLYSIITRSQSNKTHELLQNQRLQLFIFLPLPPFHLRVEITFGKNRINMSQLILICRSLSLPVLFMTPLNISPNKSLKNTFLFFHSGGRVCLTRWGAQLPWQPLMVLCLCVASEGPLRISLLGTLCTNECQPSANWPDSQAFN